MRPLHTFFFLIIVSFCNSAFSQVDTILYFGQEPPGDSAVVFAPDSISLTNRKELKITFSPDEQECFIGTVISDTFRLLHSSIVENQWTAPVPIDFPNTSFEREPMISPDSNKLFFTAPQSPTGEQWLTDIWISEKIDDNWSTPTRPSTPVNTSSEEWHPSLTSNGTLYFCSNRSGKYYLYRSEKTEEQYNNVEKLPDVINSSQFGATDPYIAPDESYLIFTSGDYTDQYISYRKEDDTWTNPKNLGSKINTEGIEYGSFVSYDSNYYFFSRIGGYGPLGWGDLYWISTGFIDSLRYTNFPPYVLNAIPDQSVPVGEAFNYTVPDSVFFDDDGNETLTLSATLSNSEDLPGWLNFNSNTFEGTPIVAEYINIKVIATDTAGSGVSDIFQLTVGNPTDSKEIESEELYIFPNPADNKIYITNLQNSEDLSYEILDINGLLIEQKKLKDNSIDVSGYDKGLYIISISMTGNKIVTKEIVIK